MNLNREFRTLVVPVIKGSPLLVLLLVVAIFLARRLIIYTNPTYQTDAAVKIDNKDYGIGNFSLFDGEMGPKQSLSSIFLTEVEIFKTRRIKELTFQQLDFDVSYFRVGSIKTSEIYYDTPFKVTYNVLNPKIYEKEIPLQYIGNETFVSITGPKKAPQIDTIQYNKTFRNDQFEILVLKNERFWKEKPDALRVGDKFAFVIHKFETLIKSVDASNYFVKPIDKEISIVKIYYKHEVPEKAALLVNTLVDTYIASSKALKDTFATQTIKFIQAQINDVEQKLKDSEGKLTTFKQSNNVVNTNLETDATLKELTALDLRKVDLDIQEVELTSIYEFLMSNNDISDFSPNFKAIGDKVFEDAYIKLQNSQLKKKDLLVRYTPNSSEVQNIQVKIDNLRTFIMESIQKKVESIKAKTAEIEGTINTVQSRLKRFPDQQRQIAELERDVELNAQTYKFLTQKRMELGIAQSSNFSFHQVIDYAQIPAKPVAPNKMLIMGLAVFLALLAGLVIIFIWNYFSNTIENKDELRDYVANIPILSTISQVKKNYLEEIEPFLNLYTNLNILHTNQQTAVQNGNGHNGVNGNAVNNLNKKGRIILLSSIMPNEGRTFVTLGLGRTMAHFGNKVLLIDMDKRKPKLHKALHMENDIGLSEILKDDVKASDAIKKTAIERLDFIAGGDMSGIPDEFVFSPKTTTFLSELQHYYDAIIIDTPPTAVVIESVALMHQVDTNLYLVKAYKSRARFVKHINTFVEEYKVPNFYLVLNGVRQKSGFYAASYRLGLRRRLINFFSGTLRRGRM